DTWTGGGRAPTGRMTPASAGAEGNAQRSDDMAETKELAGVLFRVAEPKTSKHPNYTGSCVIDERRYWIAGWVRTVKEGEREGEKYLGLAFTLADEPAASSHPSAPVDEDDGFLPR